mgnify:CR=1 FL=1|tara:strand:- start:106 stop:420 length:315 start_codon:yes stop_codon:yes gene_type:complete
MSLYYNITGSSGVTTELISPNVDASVSSLTICNTHASNDASITLFIQDNPTSGATNTYNITKLVALPAKTTLLFDNENLFNYGNKYGLYITVGSSDTVDVIINQ